MPSPLPRWNRKVHLSLSSSAISAFPEIMAGRLPHHVFRGLLSVHSRYGLHTRQVTFMTLYTGGFSRFVTSTTAPIATGWNESCRAGFAPAGKPCLCTAHMIKDVIVRGDYRSTRNSCKTSTLWAVLWVGIQVTPPCRTALPERILASVVQNQKSSMIACLLESTYLSRCFSPKGPYG